MKEIKRKSLTTDYTDLQRLILMKEIKIKKFATDYKVEFVHRLQ